MLSLFNRKNTHIRRINPDEILVFLVTLAVSAMAAARVFQLGLTKALTDQDAHLNFSRLIFDSLTPGVSQIGFWPPLLHIVMAPYAAIPYLYHSGLAGYAALLPFLCLGTIALYRLVRTMTGKRWLGLIAVALLLANPYFLYYAATPMMEVLFISNLIATAYVLARWLQDDQLKHLIWTGIFVTLTCLSRYEGLILLPIIGAIILYQLFRRRLTKGHIEATLLLFGLLAIIGITMVLLYSWIFSADHNPLNFAGGNWIRDPAANLTLTEHSVVKTFHYLVAASVWMIGRPLMLLSALATFALLFRSKNRLQTLAALAVLFSPITFIALDMYAGQSSVIVSNTPPYNFFHNDRYALTWIGFAVTAPLLFIGWMLEAAKNQVIVRRIITTLSLLGLASLLGYSILHGYTVMFKQNFPAIVQNINRPDSDQTEVAQYLASNYDYGKILTLRSNNDPVINDAGLPLSTYIYEANYRYFDQALTDPELFARFVIMHNPNDTADTWSAQNEVVYKDFSQNPDFYQYYTLVYQNSSRQVYKLNEEAVLRLALARNYNPAAIPSLTESKNLKWDPSTIYAVMGTATSLPDLTTNSLALQSALLDYYNRQLVLNYQKGFYDDAAGRGSSETQGYALLQAVDADDAATFKTVWQWDQTNLQQPVTHLLAGNFSVDSSYQVDITDSAAHPQGDILTAYALLQAAERWNQPDYAMQAQLILNGMWNEEVSHPTDGSTATLALGTATITPTLGNIATAAHSTFAQKDTAHAWNSVVFSPTPTTQNIQNIRSIYLPTNSVDPGTAKNFNEASWYWFDLYTWAYRQVAQ